MMARQILIALGAGLASALLAASLLSGTPLAFSLFLLTPLPIAIAGLGWGTLTGALAAIIAGTALGVASAPAWGLTLFALLAGPAAWLTHLAGLWRADPATPDQREWYPIGRILLHAVGLVAVTVAVVGFLSGFDPASVIDQFTAEFHALMVQTYGEADAPSPEDLRSLARLYVSVLPYSLAAINLFVLVFGLWLAGRITLASGRLARPWTPLWTAELPAVAALVFVAAAIVSFLPGIGLAAAPLAGASGLAFVLLGLAAIHAITRGARIRTALLAAIYVITALLSFFVVVLAVVGLVEALAGIRRRFPQRPTT